MKAFGTHIRRTRQRLGLTLDDVTGLTGISKPYLSLIETGNVPNPPSDEKLQRLEGALKLPPGDLLRQAHLIRTPADVRDALSELVRQQGHRPAMENERTNPISRGNPVDKSAGRGEISSRKSAFGKNLDVAYLSGVLHTLADRTTGPDLVKLTPVPVVNRVSAGYPKDFTDLAYPKGIGDEFIGCPGIADPDAFAARVSGDSMAPKYQSGEVVIFSPALPVRSGDDCFVRFDDGQTTFKQAYFEQDASGAEVIRLHARNALYTDRIIPREQVSGLYRAKFRYQTLDE